MIVEKKIPEDRIKKLKEMLRDPVVNYYWQVFQMLPQAQSVAETKIIGARNNAFAMYAKARDQYLGLIPKDEEKKH